MTLDIIVPHYNEPVETVFPLLDSIKLQGGIDFGNLQVIIVNDGKENAICPPMLPEYPFKVRCYAKHHEGVSAARNFGLDRSKADYVMFCDCDDEFLNLYGLYLVFSAMNDRYDAITSLFIEEHRQPDGSFKIIRRDNDATFVHGKVYRRQYLIDKNLRFNPKLTIHEDGYFNCLAIMCTDNKKTIETPFYIWKWRDGSVADKNDDLFVMRTYGHMIETRIAICEECKKRGYIDDYYNFICKTIFDAYYDMSKPQYLNPANADLVAKAEKAFRRFYMKFRDDYHECNIERIAEVAFVSRQKAFAGGFRLEQMTITEWLNHIVNEVG